MEITYYLIEFWAESGYYNLLQISIESFPPTDPEDYIGGSFPLVFTSTTGQNISVCSPVEIVNDNLHEAYETFLIQLSIQTGETQVILNPLIGTATIIDDDGNSCNCVCMCRWCKDIKVLYSDLFIIMVMIYMRQLKHIHITFLTFNQITTVASTWELWMWLSCTPY